MRLEESLALEIRDAVGARVVGEQRDRHHQRHDAAPVVADQSGELGARGRVEPLLQVPGRVLEHVGVARSRGDARIEGRAARERDVYEGRGGWRAARAIVRVTDGEAPRAPSPLRVIEDDGVGMGAAQASDQGSGQGLGLHSTMMAVIGGALTAESAPGAYTRITLALPEV